MASKVRKDGRFGRLKRALSKATISHSEDDLSKLQQLLRVYNAQCEELGYIPSPSVEKWFTKVIKGQSHPYEMKLRKAGLKDDDVIPLFHALKNDECIMSLDLKGNRITDGAVKVLCTILRQNSRLKGLDLRKNQITSVGGLELCDAIRDNNVLVSISLEGNGLPDYLIRQLNLNLRTPSQTPHSSIAGDTTDAKALDFHPSFFQPPTESAPGPPTMKLPPPPAREIEVRESTPPSSNRSSPAKEDSGPKLTVTVVEARGLKPLNSEDASDPFCLLQISKLRNRTSFAPRSANPRWGETFDFPIDSMDDMLYVRIMNNEHLTKDNNLGEASVSINLLRQGDKVDNWFAVNDGGALRLQLLLSDVRSSRADDSALNKLSEALAVKASSPLQVNNDHRNDWSKDGEDSPTSAASSPPPEVPIHSDEPDDEKTELDLSNRGLPSTPNLSTFTTLSTLDLSCNSITSINGIPPQILYLNLSKNYIRRIANLDHVTGLRVLDISYNSIEVLEGLNRVESLRELIAHHNSIKEVCSLDNLSNLQVMDLRKNELSTFQAVAVFSRLSLSSLSLSGNPLAEHSFYRSAVSRMIPKLKVLDEEDLPSPPESPETHTRENGQVGNQEEEDDEEEEEEESEEEEAKVAQERVNTQPVGYPSYQIPQRPTPSAALPMRDQPPSALGRQITRGPARDAGLPKKPLTPPKVQQQNPPIQHNLSIRAPSPYKGRGAGFRQESPRENVPNVSVDLWRASPARRPIKEQPTSTSSFRGPSPARRPTPSRTRGPTPQRQRSQTPTTGRRQTTPRRSRPQSKAQIVAPSKRQQVTGNTATSTNKPTKQVRKEPKRPETPTQDFGHIIGDLSDKLTKMYDSHLKELDMVEKQQQSIRSQGDVYEENDLDSTQERKVSWAPGVSSPPSNQAVPARQPAGEDWLTEFREELETTRMALKNLVDLSNLASCPRSKIDEYKQLLVECNLLVPYKMPDAILNRMPTSRQEAREHESLSALSKKLDLTKLCLEKLMTLMETEQQGSNKIARYRQLIQSSRLLETE